MAPFLRMRFNCLKAAEPFPRDSLLVPTKYRKIPDTDLIDIGSIKGWLSLGATQWFWTRDPEIGNPAP